MISIRSLLFLLSASTVFAAPYSIELRAVPSLPSTSTIVTTRNDLNDGKCGDICLIFARGTFEPGNVGDIIGPQLADAMSAVPSAAGKVIVQGLDYPADVGGYLRGGDAADAKKMGGLVVKAISQCPGTKIVLGGYSQGAQLLHKAVAGLTAAQAASIKAVLVYGDPDIGQSLPNVPSSEMMSVCHKGDPICHNGIDVGAHLTYSKDAGTTATFAINACK